MPWGILIGGEELHNNHHAYPSSVKLSNQWWEIDLGNKKTLQAVQSRLQRGAENLPETQRVILEQALAASPLLRMLYAMRQELVALWGRSNASREQLVEQLKSWLQRAETSRVIALQPFSKRLCGYG